MKKSGLVIFILMIGLLMGCQSENNEAKTNDQVDIKQLVNDLTVRNIQPASASITSSELIVMDDNQEKTVYQLPKDEFFVSIAPFINFTHGCDIHSLTGCQGELVSETLMVYIVDSDGTIIRDEEMKTEENGFIDLWLPRNDTFTVTVTQDDKSVTSNISTFDGDNTCITTMELSE